ncbi:N-acetylmuramoyl-L-alanine amidase family protein [Pontimicrobium aquaticum]|uniref:N-acetylmuramoyl-L-alanine amidase n=1 Tax=Pontimicrobium aquaticum TaxID=2565367 RepID=A0A4U0ELI9_9FLAO|nr:N-acetylmuramoyl-L-alanine amidase [Pontimicrobium aquaticum]TJY31864.1 N-acetylmuramoyl-L-alanine amidase [Pontimicrobium aquaticum]
MQTNLKYLLVSFFLLISLNIFSQKSTDKFVVVLDAGHGGKDPGRPTKYDLEKNVALKVVLQLGKELEKHKDIEVIYTRKTDVFVELHERAAIANKADADLFISIHCNAHNTQAYGTETYILSVENTDRNFEVAKAENEVVLLEDNYEIHYEGYDPNSPESVIGLTLLQEDYTEQSILLARMIEDDFAGKLKRKSRGVKQQSLLVIRGTYMPSVLVEIGFLTNKHEGKYLSSKRGQQEMSKSIYNSVLGYIDAVSENYDLEILTDNAKDKSKNKVNTDYVFKVQIAAGAKKLETKSYNFKGLRGVTSESVGNGYKYFYGVTSNYNEVKKYREEALEKGYTTAFIVAYKNGERININDALKTISN